MVARSEYETSNFGSTQLHESPLRFLYDKPRSETTGQEAGDIGVLVVTIFDDIAPDAPILYRLAPSHGRYEESGMLHDS